MAGLTTSLLRFLIVAVVAAAAGTGIYFAATHGKGGTSGQVVAGPTSTPALVETATPAIATPTSTEPAATEIPPTAIPTSYPTLPPAPPKPEHPTEVQGGEWGNLAGGQWYRLLGCTDFYLPTGRTFSLQVILVDPGGALIAFTEKSSGASISFHRDTLSERTRTDDSGELGPAFDQIAATISTIC